MEVTHSVEILAPAGSYESFQAAIAAGADAVYLGGSQFGARAYAQNFTEEELLRAIDYAHLHGRRLYLTVNTLLKESELSGQLYDYLKPLYCQGLDAVIVQDMGVLRYIKRRFPGLELHASTQMTVTGSRGASFLKGFGVKRIVPARELSLEEVRDMKRQTGLEIECFVHGALCYCYSGQCLLSSLIGGRSGNRGQCAQPCRLPYEYRGKKGHLLSLKDICTLELIPEMLEAGIDSFKIEGRMKKPEYVAGVVSVYRKYVDLYHKVGKEKFRVQEEDREMLMDLYNRGGFHDGYYHTKNGLEMLAVKRPNHAGTPAAKVLSQKGREVRIQALKPLAKGDILDLSGKYGNYTLGRESSKGEICTILVPKGCRLSKGTVLARTRCAELIDRLKAEYADRKMQEKIHGLLRLFPGKPATLELFCKGQHIVVSGEEVQFASNRPLEEERVRRQMEKTGGTPFLFDKLEIFMGEDCFYPMQQLNALRREAIQKLEEQIVKKFRREEPVIASSDIERAKNYRGVRRDLLQDGRMCLSVNAETPEQMEAVAGADIRTDRLYVDCSLLLRKETEENVQKLIEHLRDAGTEVFLSLPYICRDRTTRQIASSLGKWRELTDGVLVRNLESIQMLRELRFDKTVITDHNLYVFNQEARAFLAETGFSEFTAPLELNARELAELGIENGELIVYGYEPVMISAQCLEKNCTGCAADRDHAVRKGVSHPETPEDRDQYDFSVHMLTDRYRKQFAVRNCCLFCYNIIYNTEPLLLFGETEKIRALNPSACRLMFTRENADEVRKVLSLYRQTISEGAQMAGKDQTYTKGHFRRGIK